MTAFGLPFAALLGSAPAAPAPTETAATGRAATRGAATENTPPGRPARLDIKGLVRVLDGWSARLGADARGSFDPAALRRDLPALWEVTTVDGPIGVPTKWLREALDDLVSHPESRPCVVRSLRERLAALGREARASAEASGPPATEARPVLKRVLSRREFAGLAESGFLAALRERVLEWMDAHLGWLINAVRGSPVAGEAIAWSFLAAALAILALWARRAWSWPAGATALRPLRALLQDEAPVDAADEARAAAGRGEHREAVRRAYAAALQILTARDRLSSDRSRTHRELLRSMPEGEACRQPFVELTRLFERIWYGSLRAEPDDAALALSELERLGGALSLPAATVRS